MAKLFTTSKMAQSSESDLTPQSPAALPSPSTAHSIISHAPPPWTTKCTTYVFAFRVSPTTPLPTHIVYSPLSASHGPFSSESLAGKFHGGLAKVQIVRYSETPVGPYDELVIMPGDFEVPVLNGGDSGGGSGGKKKVKKNSRITGIWVSQKDTCWNGRKNWNIPKHLARFTFTPHNSSSSSTSSTSTSNSFPPPPLTITVSPQSPLTAPPFFTCTILPVSYFPFSFPLSTSWGSLLGLDPHLVQPPLPTGPEDAPELCGSADWKKSLPVLDSRAARVVWFDLRQPVREGREGVEGMGEGEGDALLRGGENKSEEENWWPGGGRWRLGIWCQEAKLVLGEAEILG